MPSATFRVEAISPARRTFGGAGSDSVTLDGVAVRSVPVPDQRWADLEGWYADSANGQLGFTVFEHLEDWKAGFEFDMLVQLGEGPPAATYLVGGLEKVSRFVGSHGWLSGRRLDGVRVKAAAARFAPADAVAGVHLPPGVRVGFDVFNVAAVAFTAWRGKPFHFLITPRRSSAHA